MKKKDDLIKDLSEIIKSLKKDVDELKGSKGSVLPVNNDVSSTPVPQGNFQSTIVSTASQEEVIKMKPVVDGELEALMRKYKLVQLVSTIFQSL